MKARGMAKQHLITDNTRAGTIFAETDDELAYLVFVAPDYLERFADEPSSSEAKPKAGTYSAVWLRTKLT